MVTHSACSTSALRSAALTFEVGDELSGCVVHSNGEDHGLEPVDSVDFKVDFLSLHLFLEEIEGVDCFDHFAS